LRERRAARRRAAAVHPSPVEGTGLANRDRPAGAIGQCHRILAIRPVSRGPDPQPA
jgi:hypothetical protein